MQAVPTYTCACSAHIANETKRGFERRIFKTSKLILHPAASLVKAKRKGGKKKRCYWRNILHVSYRPRPPFWPRQIIVTLHQFKNERNRPVEYLGKKTVLPRWPNIILVPLGGTHSRVTHPKQGYLPQTVTVILRTRQLQGKQDYQLPHHRELERNIGGKGDHLTPYIHFILGRKKSLQVYT